MWMQITYQIYHANCHNRLHIIHINILQLCLAAKHPLPQKGKNKKKVSDLIMHCRPLQMLDLLKALSKRKKPYKCPD